MRWQVGRRSTNVEDRRGNSGGVPPTAAGGIGIVLLALVAMFFGVDPSIILNAGISPDTEPYSPTESSAPRSAAEDSMADFVSVVLADTEDTWHNLFNELGGTYQEPKLVLFSGVVESACGNAQAAMGPFYCPNDRKVYIDLSFYDDLRNRHQAPGDFAQAYVIAHEIGHHVQTLLGISEQVRAYQNRVSPVEANQLSVRQELQADCFAGIWAHHAQRSRHLLESGDIEEGLNAASSIGDDRLQYEAQGYVVPESFTHGSSAQRVRWFQQGFDRGNLEACDTFEAAQL